MRQSGAVSGAVHAGCVTRLVYPALGWVHHAPGSLDAGCITPWECHLLGGSHIQRITHWVRQALGAYCTGCINHAMGVSCAGCITP